jgi:hypothetical protein
MNTQSTTVLPADLNNPALRESDSAAVLEHFTSGHPLDPVVLERVHARAEQITESIRRDRGLVDDDTFQTLLDDEA